MSDPCSKFEKGGQKLWSLWWTKRVQTHKHIYTQVILYLSIVQCHQLHWTDNNTDIKNKGKGTEVIGKIP